MIEGKTLREFEKAASFKLLWNIQIEYVCVYIWFGSTFAVLTSLGAFRVSRFFLFLLCYLYKESILS